MKNENVAPKNKAEFLSMIADGTIIDWTLDYSAPSAKRLVVVFADGTVRPGLKGQMAYNVEKSREPGKYLAFVRVGTAGSSWSHADTPELAAYMAIRVRNSDWGRMYKFTGAFGVRIFLNSPNGWYADASAVYDAETNKPLEYVKTFLRHDDGMVDGLGMND